MSNVVYLLGAGFSAPLGLPVMRDFLVKSKDMLEADRHRYAHFEKVFGLIRSMGIVQSYYEADLFNIEEILSILEMGERIGGKRAQPFIQYIIDVIDFYTPPPPKAHPARMPGNWWDNLIQENAEWSPYLYFAGNLLGLRMREDRSNANRTFPIDKHGALQNNYSIVTLNYDLVFEILAEFLATYFPNGDSFRFNKESGALVADGATVPLAKLHGSVDTRKIIAPTWNKGISKSMASTWSLAHQSLKTANEIRVIGYSLPIADAYIKYLLKSAVVEAPHLKHFDIIARDADGSTRRRYKDFVTFKYARYSDSDVRDYLQQIEQLSKGRGRLPDGSLAFNQLESAHAKFFSQPGNSL